jgi:HK97 family phage portal protein
MRPPKFMRRLFASGAGQEPAGQELATIEAASPENPSTPLSNPAGWLVEWLGGGPSDAGIAITKSSSLQSTTVWRCVNLIASTIAAMPFRVMKEIPRGEQAATGHYLTPILESEPNEFMSSFIWRESMLANLLLSGNAYSVIEWTGAGRVGSLVPILPEQVTVELVDGRVQYRIRLLTGGGFEVIDQADMLHIPGFGFDGLKGLSVISAVLRNPAGLALSLDKTIGRTSLNNLRPSAIITAPKLMPDAIARLKATIKAQNAGAEQAGEPLFLDGGIEIKPWQINPADAQLLEQRKYQVTDIARIFGVPAHMVGDVEKHSSFGTGMEQQTIAFVQFGLRAWTDRIEQELNRKLFSGSPFFCKFQIDTLMRGDSATRTEYYSKMIQNGVMTPNEARAEEGLPPMPDGDTLFIASNLIPLSRALVEQPTPTPAPAAPARRAPAEPSPAEGD